MHAALHGLPLYDDAAPPLAKLIVELHGGRVQVTSEGEGKGTTFVVELPA